MTSMTLYYRTASTEMNEDEVKPVIRFSNNDNMWEYNHKEDDESISSNTNSNG